MTNAQAYKSFIRSDGEMVRFRIHTDTLDNSFDFNTTSGVVATGLCCYSRKQHVVS